MSNMYKSVGFFGAFNERTGYGQHATNLCRELEKLIPLKRNEIGDVNISLLDVVTAAHTTVRHPYPSILYTVWESTEYPAEFMDKIKLYDQMWAVSEWERSNAIAQGIPEEFIKVVHEGVDPEIFKPIEQPISDTFNFLHVGQWQPRKSTKEIIESFLAAFPDNPNVRLYLSVDTLFPSDNYKSTEERLNAYGFTDSRIIPIHFEERDQYVRRLQSANVFVSCSRAEGWGLPQCESIACGIPTIVADWSGSTEYAGDAIKVRVVDFKKPEGIYGNWDVPGVWGEPDFVHLIGQMKDAYENYAVHKEKALKTSEMIREKFSWEAAAQKAYNLLQELPQKIEQIVPSICTPEEEVRQFARSKGFEVTTIKPRKAIFAVDCWPASQDKMDTLSETIKQIQGLGYPVLVVSHYPLPAPITELADFYLYEKADRMSGTDKSVYWRQKLDGTVEHKQCTVEYQGVACLNNFRNAIDFCRGKYDWVYMMGSDTEVDLVHWLSLVHKSEKPMVCIPYEGKKDGIGGGLWAGKTEMLDKVLPYLSSWDEYAKTYPDLRFIVERWQYKYVVSKVNIDESIDWIDIETTNRFDAVDREIWKDDEFQCHFVDGPYLNIVGISNREYDVSYSNPIDGNLYVLKQKTGMWSRPSKKYFREWTVKASLNGELKYEHHLNLSGRNIIVSMGSKALGDTIAWIPYVDEFRKKHGCNIYCSTWWNNIMDYPELHFIKPGDVINDVYATYDVGCYDDQLDKNVINWRLSPLQKVSSDILGLEYEPLKAKLKYEPCKGGNGNEPKPYICFSEYSTMQNKMWNRPGSWQKVIDYLNELGYDCISISVEPSQLTGIINHNAQSIEKTLADISGAKFYIGLNAGPSWLAYSLDIPVIMIVGISEPWNDFPMFARISTDDCRPGCFNDPSLPIDRGWNWCPREKDYVCTGNITEEMVIEQINRLREESKCQLPSEKLEENSELVLRMPFTAREQPLQKQSLRNVF